MSAKCYRCATVWYGLDVVPLHHCPPIPESSVTEHERALSLVRAALEACVRVAEAEGAVPKEEGGTLTRWDACDNVAREIRALDAEAIVAAWEKERK